MKIKVDDDRVFPSLGITVQAGDEVDVPSEKPAEEVKSSKASKVAPDKESE